MNTQKPSPISNNPHQLEITECFYSIQGEGPFAGRPATFLRLAGCNLRCPFCDTNYKRLTTLNPRNTVDLVTATKKNNTNLVVITGGEPFRQNISELLIELNSAGYEIQIETNGTVKPQPSVLAVLSRIRPVIVCSPKGRITKELQPFITAYKYVIGYNVDPEDGLPQNVLGLEMRPDRPRNGFDGIVYVQPMDEHQPKLNALHNELTVKVAQEHDYVICVQMHKFLNVE